MIAFCREAVAVQYLIEHPLHHIVGNFLLFTAVPAYQMVMLVWLGDLKIHFAVACIR